MGIPGRVVSLVVPVIEVELGIDATEA